MRVSRRSVRGSLWACVIVGAAATTTLSAAAADAAPRALRVDQVPNVGITVGPNGISGGFAANVAATATSAGTTRLGLQPIADACTGSLRQARVGVTWRNERTNRTDDAVFPVCAAGKPGPGVEAVTGTGRISFTTTIIGRTDQAFTVVPGTGFFFR